MGGSWRTAPTPYLAVQLGQRATRVVVWKGASMGATQLCDTFAIERGVRAVLYHSPVAWRRRDLEVFIEAGRRAVQ